jgi:hypothetical protein
MTSFFAFGSVTVHPACMARGSKHNALPFKDGSKKCSTRIELGRTRFAVKTTLRNP